MEYLDTTVLGHPGRVNSDADRFYVTASFFNATAGGSPYVVTIDPPIGPISEVSLGALDTFLTGAVGGLLAAGATLA